MIASPQPRVPHLRDGHIVAKVGIRANARTAPAHFNGATIPEVD